MKVTLSSACYSADTHDSGSQRKGRVRVPCVAWAAYPHEGLPGSVRAQTMPRILARQDRKLAGERQAQNAVRCSTPSFRQGHGNAPAVALTRTSQY